MKVPSGWDSSTYQKFQSELLLLEDKTYKEFNFKLIFTDYKKIGIRVPILKELAKKISKNDPFSFLEVVEEEYYEEVLLEGLVIANLKDLKDTLFYLERYIEKIDNWALCDYVISNLKMAEEHKEKYKKLTKQITSQLKKGEKLKTPALFFVKNGKIENYSLDYEVITTGNKEGYSEKEKKALRKKYINLIEKYQEKMTS